VSPARDAFQLMAKGGHIGKIVLSMQDQAAMVRRDLSRFEADATYLITGGLGGLGLVAAQEFVGHGSRNLVLTSRRDPSAEARQVIEKLEGLGARVNVRQADVSVDAQV